jgi:hypothetical protein
MTKQAAVCGTPQTQVDFGTLTPPGRWSIDPAEGAGKRLKVQEIG